MASRLNWMASMLLVAGFAARLFAQTPLGTDFTYQGQLKGSGAITAADFRFSLFNAETGGAQVGSTSAKDNVGIIGGLFTVSLDFGATSFNGDAPWLEVEVRSPAGSGNFTTLTPRQPLTVAPYALQTRGIFVDAGGKVGIGTTSPERVLHTVGDAVLIERAANTPAVMLRNTLNGQIDAQFGLEATGANDGYAFLTNQSLVRTLHLRGGNVGIGTSIPSKPLHIRAEEPVLILQDPGSASTQSGHIGFWNGNPTETASIGFAPPSGPSFSIVNARAGGDIVLTPGAGGAVSVPILQITGADLAEKFPASEKLEPGIVVAIDKQNPGKLCLARGAYNRCVAGIVSGANNFSVGAVLGSAPGCGDDRTSDSTKLRPHVLSIAEFPVRSLPFPLVCDPSHLARAPLTYLEVTHNERLA